MTSNNQRLHYLLHLVFYLINKLDQINSQNNDDALRSLATSTKLRLPMIVELGSASRRYYITNIIESNDICNTYEAYMISDMFVSKTPSILKAYRQDKDDTDLPYYLQDKVDTDQNFFDDLKSIVQRKWKNVVVDRTRSIIVFGGEVYDEGIDPSQVLFPPWA
jgi:hypothetical protein